MQTGRLFFALWPDATTADQLFMRQQELEGGRRSHVRDLHLTLAFLGAQPIEQLDALKAVVSTTEFAPIDLNIDCYGEFAKQKVVWAGLSHVPPELPALRERLLSSPALSSLPFRREAGFVPHITLARKAPLPQVPFKPIAWRAARFALAESIGGDAVPRYRLLACREL